MSELAPKGTGARMTQAQVKAYIKKMKIAQQIAQKKLEKAKNSPEAKIDKLELTLLEEKIDNL